MDPTANLAEQLALAAHILNDDPQRDQDATPEDAERLAELVIALNEWIQKGGALPIQWPRD